MQPVNGGRRGQLAGWLGAALRPTALAARATGRRGRTRAKSGVSGAARGDWPIWRRSVVPGVAGALSVCPGALQGLQARLCFRDPGVVGGVMHGEGCYGGVEKFGGARWNR